MNAVFGRLRLQHLIGRTGSVRARVIVVGIFLLALLIPLQSALNQLTREFRTRQAISRAQAVFDVPGRSTVLDSSFVLRERDVRVRIQVATNTLFTAEDIARFEERVFDQVGRPARLDLVQTLSDIGQADTIREMLVARGRAPAEERPRTAAESLQETRDLVERAVAELPLPDAVRILGIRGVLVGPAGTAIELVYLADRAMGADAHAVLTRLLAGRTRIPESRLRLRWVPDVVRVGVSRTGSVLPGSEPALLELRGLLTEWPGLTPTLAVPPGFPERAAEAARTEIQKQLMVADLTQESGPDNLDTRTVLVRIAVPD